MLLALAAILFGFAGLIWSADRFVTGAAASANMLGMSPLMIGVTVVSFGTSAPELLVAANAALANASDMAVGNAIGSNLANMGLVLGCTALVAAIPIARPLLRNEFPVLLVTTAAAGFCLMDAHLSRLDGLILLGLLVGSLIWLFKRQPATDADSDIPKLNGRLAIAYLIGGLLALVISANILVWGAKEIATLMGVSQLIIGLTLVAVGTSLPELAASLVSALKGHTDIALGNILGSNMFNLLAVMAVPALIAPTGLEAAVFSRDYLSMAAMTAMLAVIVYADARIKGEFSTIGKIAGVTLLGSYALYYALLFS